MFRAMTGMSKEEFFSVPAARWMTGCACPVRDRRRRVRCGLREYAIPAAKPIESSDASDMTIATANLRWQMEKSSRSAQITRRCGGAR